MPALATTATTTTTRPGGSTTLTGPRFSAGGSLVVARRLRVGVVRRERGVVGRLEEVT